MLKKLNIESLKGQFTALTTQNEELSKKLGDTTTALNTANAALKTTQESLAKELASQHDWADVATTAQEERDKYRDFAELVLSTLEDDLKMTTTGSETKEIRLQNIVDTTMSSMDLDQKYQARVKELEDENKRLLAMTKPVADMTVGELISQLVKSIFGR